MSHTVGVEMNDGAGPVRVDTSLAGRRSDGSANVVRAARRSALQDLGAPTPDSLIDLITRADMIEPTLSDTDHY